MDTNTRAIAFDFASTMDIIQKVSLTCTHAGHAYILVVFVTGYKGDDENGERMYNTTCFYFWGGRSKGEVEKNYYFTVNAIEKVISVTEAKRKREYDALPSTELLSGGVQMNIEKMPFLKGNYVLMSDGCGAENKNAAAVHGAISCLPHSSKLNVNIQWQFACTNGFKGPWDGMGNQPKKDIRKEIILNRPGRLLIREPYDCYRFSKEKRQPEPKTATDRRMYSIDEIVHFFVIDDKHKGEVDPNDKNILLFDMRGCGWAARFSGKIKSLQSFDTNRNRAVGFASNEKSEIVVGAFNNCNCNHCIRNQGGSATIRSQCPNNAFINYHTETTQRQLYKPKNTKVSPIGFYNGPDLGDGRYTIVVSSLSDDMKGQVYGIMIKGPEVSAYARTNLKIPSVQRRVFTIENKSLYVIVRWLQQGVSGLYSFVQNEEGSDFPVNHLILPSNYQDLAISRENHIKIEEVPGPNGEPSEYSLHVNELV
jgi:hypothetical protein